MMEKWEILLMGENRAALCEGIPGVRWLGFLKGVM
jgi:hypothetical protein